MLSFLRRMFGSYEFIIELSEGKARAVKGKVLNRMLRDFAACAQDLRICRGTIYGERGPGHIRLAFSKDIPPSAHQRFRNLWSQYAQ